MSDVLYDILPPHCLEAEQAVLGSILLDNAALRLACEILTPESFYRDAHRYIFEAMQTLAAQDDPVDLITLPVALNAVGRLDFVGNLLYLHNLMEAPSSSANIAYYCRLVEGAALRRQMLESARQVQQLASAPDLDTDAFLEQAQRLITEVGKQRAVSTLHTLPPLLAAELDGIEARAQFSQTLTGLATPWEDLNYLTAGLQPGDLILVAARPSMGKTSFAVQMGTFAAQQSGRPVLVFSLEMAKEQIVRRMLACEARVSAHSLKTGLLSPDDWRQLALAGQRLAKAPVFVDDATSLTPEHLRRRALQVQAEQGDLALVVVDYLQLLRLPQKMDNHAMEIAGIAKEIKALARSLGVPIVALSQVSRACEGRPNKRPMLSDLAESGGLEAHADVVVFLYRDSYYKGRKDDGGPIKAFEEVEMIVAKHRNGATGTLTTGFWPSYTRFEDIDDTHVHEPYRDPYAEEE